MAKQNEWKRTMRMKDETINETFEESYLIYFEINFFEQKKVPNNSNTYKKVGIRKAWKNL